MLLAQDDVSQPVLSVIMVNHNHSVLAKKAVEKVVSLDDRVTFELILVDNASTDDVAEWIGVHFPGVRLIRNKSAHGFAHNCNKGLGVAKSGKYFVLMNPDIQCMPGVLDTLVDFMDLRHEVGIAGPKLVNEDGTVQTSCRRFSTPTSILIRGLHLDRILRNTITIRDYLMIEFDHASAAEVDWVTGAFQIVRRAAIEPIGLMDERYFLYSEDQDWCCRMWRGGWKVCYVPQAQAIHFHMREGMRRPWSKATRYQIVSAFQMFRKFGWHLSRAI